MNCDFCDKQVDENQLILKNKFFKILYPQKPVIKHHFLLMPIGHKESLDDLNDKESIELINLIRLIKNKIKQNDNFAGYNIISNTGTKAGQKVDHTHVHLFIRFEDEEVSPFAVLNSPDKYKRTLLDPETMRKRIKEFQSLFT